LEPIDSKLQQWLFSMGLLLPGYSLPKAETAKAKELSEIEALQVTSTPFLLYLSNYCS
jgi:hypothetical protein